MLRRTVKYGLIGTAAVVLVGGLVFGSDLFSYVGSGVRSMRESVRENIPLDVELERARHQLDQIVPEMHANIKLIAQEEVEIQSLKKDIVQTTTALGDEKARIERMTGWLATEQASFETGGLTYSREAIRDDLSRRFENYKETEVVLAGKQRLLETRQKSLQAAIAMLDKTRSRKAVLADRIEMLASQHRLVQAAAAGSQLQLDGSKLASTEKLIQDIQKRLDVAERVLAHEGRFVQTIEVPTVDEADLVAQVNEHFHPAPETASDALAAAATTPSDE